VTEPDPRALTRAHFDHLVEVSTRWADNDAYGHLNNAVYYALFDTAITGWLAAGLGAPVGSLGAWGVVVETGCRYFRELAFPTPVHAAVRVERVGRTSVTYATGLFAADAEPLAALGHWVHVYVDRDTRRPVPVPDEVRRLLEAAVAAR
jgi:acyl-CoA thioester hydrolase